jgi:kynurenine formamidase
MLVDVSMPIRSGSVFRPGTPPVDISVRKFYHDSEGEYESTLLSLPAHTATHVDLVFPGKMVSLERMIGPGKLIDARQSRSSTIRLADVEGQVEVSAGDFVFFRTGWDRFAGTERYFEHPELSLDVVHWLVAKRINAVGIDALGLGRGRRHGEYDRLLAGNEMFVIENLVDLARVEARVFKVYCFPLKLDDIDAIPARVVIETGPARR